MEIPERIPFEFSNKDVALEQVLNSGKAVLETVMINLDENHIPTNGYFVVVDAPPPQPDLLAHADARILDLEYQLILAKEGL